LRDFRGRPLNAVRARAHVAVGDAHARLQNLCSDGNERIVLAYDFEGSGDVAALEESKKHSHGTVLEVWEGARFVTMASMYHYEIRVLRDDGTTELLLAAIHPNDNAAMRGARKFAAGRKFEVWRGKERIYGTVGATIINLTISNSPEP
jgi:hypothetical protein